MLTGSDYTMEIELVTAPSDEVRALIGELEAILSAVYAPEQRHGLSLEAIFQPHIRFFLARLDGVAAGCGGVALFPDFAEAKRMYVREAMRGLGIAQGLLMRIEDEARAAGLPVLRLETGRQQLAALRLYEAAAFVRCGAFGAYRTMSPEAISTSIFLEKPLV